MEKDVCEFILSTDLLKAVKIIQVKNFQLKTSKKGAL